MLFKSIIKTQIDCAQMTGELTTKKGCSKHLPALHRILSYLRYAITVKFI